MDLYRLVRCVLADIYKMTVTAITSPKHMFLMRLHSTSVNGMFNDWLYISFQTLLSPVKLENKLLAIDRRNFDS